MHVWVIECVDERDVYAVVLTKERARKELQDIADEYNASEDNTGAAKVHDHKMGSDEWLSLKYFGDEAYVASKHEVTE